jgi:FtsP/CotA-like multicopper oxidase with cupredoxin domain
MLTRRQLVKTGVAGAAGLATAGMFDSVGALAARPVARRLTPYLDRMPTLLDNLIDASGARGATYDVTLALVRRKVHKQLPAAQLFGFLHAGGPGISDPVASYLAPTFVAKQNVGFNVRYHNKLAPDAYLNVFRTPRARGSSYLQFPPHPEVRTLTHLHGGFVAGKDDGNPYQDFDAVPSGKVQTVTYPNEDRATLLWYHDHYQGDTRMNVVAGLAGGFLVRDRHDTGNGSLGLPHNASGRGLYELPLVIQDRQWNADGSLLYPVAPRKSHGPWISEYFGDTMLVNGKIWPFLVVDPCLYRFRILNGCNARILSLNIPGAKLTVIGSELGFLPAPVSAQAIVMAPAERYDVLVDFSALAGKTGYMKNQTPGRPVSGPAPPLTPVMQFRVNHTHRRRAPELARRPARVQRRSSCPARTAEAQRWHPPRPRDRSQRTRPGHGGMETEPQRDPVRWEGEHVQADAAAQRRRGLVLRQYDGGHSPYAHPPVQLPGDGALQLRRERSRGRIQGSQRRRPNPRDAAKEVPQIGPDPVPTGGGRLQGHGQREPEADHSRAGQIQPPGHRSQRGRQRRRRRAALRPSLPHRRTRRQRHDGALRRGRPRTTAAAIGGDWGRDRVR